MKLNKSDLNKALKKVSIFVGKNSTTESLSLVHFHNENKQAMMFATDLNCAGRVYVDTEYDDVFDFCVEYSQLAQATKLRGKEITIEKFTDRADENGVKKSGIEFYDEKTRLEFPLRDAEELLAIENNSLMLPETSCVTAKAKMLKEALKCGGYASNEKETQNIALTGVYFAYDNNVFTLQSTDRNRIASWKGNSETVLTSASMSGIFSTKTVDSIMLIDDDDDVSLYIDDAQVVLATKDLVAYTTKINAEYPSLSKFFETEIKSSYEVNSAAIIESVNIVSGSDTDDLNLRFSEGKVVISTVSSSGAYVEDVIECNKLTGNDENIWISTKYFLDVFKSVTGDKIVIEFRNDEPKLIAYSSGESYGMIAPRRK